jgi:uncharacterized membrane protein YphA (DoxX/SURF4 family)
MFDQSPSAAARNSISDWFLRGAIAVAFVLFGLEKFPDGPQNSWVELFAKIGIGQWFRYFTGVVEVLGGLLLLTPWTVSAGLVLLGCTMASAALIQIFVIRRPADGIPAAGIFLGLLAYWWNRRKRRTIE